MLWYATAYLCVALLMGEVYKRGCRKVNKPVRAAPYILGTSLWPVSVILGIIMLAGGKLK